MRRAAESCTSPPNESASAAGLLPALTQFNDFLQTSKRPPVSCTRWLGEAPQQPPRTDPGLLGALGKTLAHPSVPGCGALAACEKPTGETNNHIIR